MRTECREKVAAALGRSKLSAQDSKRFTQMYTRAKNVLAQQDPDWVFKTDVERADAIANKVASDIARMVQKNNENLARDAILSVKLRQEIYGHKKLNPLQVLARKIAYFSDQSGVRSVENTAKIMSSRWLSRASDVFTETQRGFGFLVDKQKSDDIVRAIFGMKGLDPEVQRIAESVSGVIEDVRQTYNRYGGDIKFRDDYGLPTSHDQTKVSMAGKSKWIESITPKLDRSKFINDLGNPMNDRELNLLLGDIYDTISTGGANKELLNQDSFSPTGGRGKMANKHQDARSLHFKDGDAWLAYQSEFGTFHQSGLPDLINNHINRMSNEIALMKEFGSNPRNMFESLLKEATASEKVKPENGTKFGKIDLQRKRAQDMYNTLDFQTMPIDNAFGNVMSGLRSLMTASKLGSATLTSFSDQVNTARTARMNGISYTRSFLPEFFKQLFTSGARKEAISHGLGVQEMVGSMMRFGDPDMVSMASRSGRFAGTMRQVAGAVLKASGLNAITAASKRAYSIVHMNKIADMTRTKSWEQLGEQDLKMLKGNGIDKADWDLWQSITPSKRDDGTMILSQHDFFAAPDDVIAKALGKENPTADELVKARYDFSARYMNHIFSEEAVAVLDAGVRERSLIDFGQAGTFNGELGRTLFQFKSYPMGYLMRMGSRAFAQDDITSRATFIISLMAWQTIAGGMVVQAQNIANGKNPEQVMTKDFFLKSLLKGGGFSFLGDLVSSMSDQSGRGVGDFTAGPLVGSVFGLGMLLTGMGDNVLKDKEINKGVALANAIKSNIPFQNLWWSKIIVDRMLYSKLQNMIDPNYTEKTQRRLENLGNSYYINLDGSVNSD